MLNLFRFWIRVNTILVSSKILPNAPQLNTIFFCRYLVHWNSLTYVLIPQKTIVSNCNPIPAVSIMVPNQTHLFAVPNINYEFRHKFDRPTNWSWGKQWPNDSATKAIYKRHTIQHKQNYWGHREQSASIRNGNASASEF